ncbi:SET domain-containing protein-lysine N-methyltransferase [Photobacterium leiognathi]|uniref:SET domain-containing protein-lysine N-methyltransferase n=1 Tax=Photobacterium leiognathi TaxID=553611 RepID=UPI002739C764|nr:SET domain-containing protein-lysine N-methyltransferase [Photobacterium leiognathi]
MWVQSLPLKLPGPEIDNNAPTLRRPNTPLKSAHDLTEASIDSLKVSKYSADLKSQITCLSPKEQATTKKEILTQCKAYLTKEMKGEHGEVIDFWTEVSTPLYGTERGQSVFAKRDIPKFTVLGAYAGVLHENEASLRDAIRRQGSQSVLAYLFETGSSRRAVDASRFSNSLALMNTSHLPYDDSEKSLGNGNNIGPVRIGTNYTFYVALKFIPSGEELLVDYGDAYNPHAHSGTIKTEDGADN